MVSACGKTCDGKCGWCRLTAERDALKIANQMAYDKHVDLEAEVARVAAKLHDGTLHESTCSANHDKEVGGDTCSCTLGRRLKAMKAEVEMVKGAMAADDKRLSDAAVRVWSEHRWGCDTPDHMADTILALRDDAKRLREAVGHYGAHEDDCGRRRNGAEFSLSSQMPGPCTCGLEAALHPEGKQEEQT